MLQRVRHILIAMSEPTKNIKLLFLQSYILTFVIVVVITVMIAFFSYVIHEYTNNSELMSQVVCDIMEKRKLKSKRIIRVKARLTKQGEKNEEEFSSDDEIEDMYDIIERFDIDEM